MKKIYSKYIVSSTERLKDVVAKLDYVPEKTLFIVDENNKLLGSLTDGDFRRFMINNHSLSLKINVMNVANPNPFYTLENKRPHFFEHNIIPYVNEEKILQKIFFKETRRIEIGSHIVSNSSEVFFIAEIGNNHNGSIENAKKLINISKGAGAHAVKFQLRNMNDLYREKSLRNIDNDLSVEYTIDLLNKFQLKKESHIELKEYCDDLGILYLCTPWDKSSVGFLEENFNLPAYKIASADFVNVPLLEKVSQTGKPLILSTGMTTENEIIYISNLLNDWGVKFVLLHCNSTYPAAPSDINLSYIKTLKKYNNLVGYSGHERGTSISLAAVATGAVMIERHVTLDRKMEGPDHVASLEPDELKFLTSQIREVSSSLGFSKSRKLSQGELINRENLGKSIVASREVNVGDIVSKNALKIVSPGIGLSPLKMDDLIGKTALRKLEVDDYFFQSDIDGNQTTQKNFNFNLRWGIPVRYHDFSKFSQRINPDIYEFHLSYKDLELDFNNFIPNQVQSSLVVHAPELFENDHILDLTSTDLEYRNRSIELLQRVVDLSNKLSSMFVVRSKVPIVVNVGGFSVDKNISSELKQEKLKLLEDSFGKINLGITELLPQSMPPFPWHFGGQRFHNLFVTDDDLSSFCEKFNSRICLDISHSYLSAKLLNIPFDIFLKNVAKYSAHYHFADANNLNGEGIQVGEGDIDFECVIKIVQEESPDASFIPEVWQGHKDNGSGFWKALNFLERQNL